MKKILVIGGGPGGYVAAIKAAQMGAEVHLAESGSLGGTCLNIGCIPTKALLHSAFFYKEIIGGSVAGVRAEKVSLDWAAVQGQKRAVTDRLAKGVGGLLAANKVKVHAGKAVFADRRTVLASGNALPSMDAIIIASGSAPVQLNFPGADLPQVVDSTQALSLGKIPASITIIGGGAIGVEFASIFSSLGANVHIAEMMPEILPPIDKQIAALARSGLEKNGVSILTGAKLAGVAKGKGKTVCAEIEYEGALKQIESEIVLVAVGRKPYTEGLGLEKAGIRTERGAIAIDENFETSAKNIFAVGDCNALNMLAHAASAQGEAAVEFILGGKHDYPAAIIPSCIYTQPEIAAVGLTEEAAKARGLDYAVGCFDLGGNGKAMIDGGGGLVKIIADRQFGEIVGVHMIGPHVTDMIAEASAVMRMEGLADNLVRTVHPHPSVSEAVREAAMAVFGNAIHWPPKR
ncbi:MAG: dihydrolipoyl dehydrogenase [Clostridiales Family XIII bacterium]|jgi:dihydrolipoamide dehydrogenase|nr:dihydrolipoyl dehydrogenase [Clostridiales Family XIII bacterium]